MRGNRRLLFGNLLKNDFLPFVRSSFAAKPKTRAYYENGVQRILDFERLAEEPLDTMSGDRVAEYITYRKAAAGKHGRPLQVSSINRELEVLRRMFGLAGNGARSKRAFQKSRNSPERTAASVC